MQVDADEDGQKDRRIRERKQAEGFFFSDAWKGTLRFALCDLCGFAQSDEEPGRISAEIIG